MTELTWLHTLHACGNPAQPLIHQRRRMESPGWARLSRTLVTFWLSFLLWEPHSKCVSPCPVLLHGVRWGGRRMSQHLSPSISLSTPPPGIPGPPATCLRVHWPHLAGCLAWEGIAAELFGCRSGCWAQEWASRHQDGICFVSWGKEEDSYSFYCEKTRLRQGHIPALGNFKSCFLSPPRICSPTPCRGSLPYVRSPRPVPGIVVVTRIKVTLSVSLIML